MSGECFYGWNMSSFLLIVNLSWRLWPCVAWAAWAIAGGIIFLLGRRMKRKRKTQVWKRADNLFFLSLCPPVVVFFSFFSRELRRHNSLFWKRVFLIFFLSVRASNRERIYARLTVKELEKTLDMNRQIWRFLFPFSVGTCQATFQPL